MGGYTVTSGDEEKKLYDRVDGLFERAARGEIAIGDYFTPREIYLAKAYALRRGNGDALLFYGGYPDAERAAPIALPSFYVGDGDAFSGPFADLILSEWREAHTALSLTGSKFRTLTHRDYLGAIMALGIRRDTLGDVLVTGDHEAVVFATAAMARYLMDTLESVGSDRVSVARCDPETVVSYRHERLPIEGTVASARLDCVIGELIHASRAQACEEIRAGFVEHNYKTAEDADETVFAGDVISVRGHGKYNVCELSDVTKKGRIRLRAEKYV